MDSIKEWWTINDFARVVSETYNQRFGTNEKSLHYNTIYNWFNELEYQRIHFVQRLEGNDKKIFDEMDLEIAVFIKALRNKKWTIDQIMTAVAKQCEVRDFPDGDIHLPSSELSDIEKLMRAEFETMKRNMESKFEERINVMVERRLELLVDERISERETELLEKMANLERALPAPKTDDQLKEEQDKVVELAIEKFKIKEDLLKEEIGELKEQENLQKKEIEELKEVTVKRKSEEEIEAELQQAQLIQARFIFTLQNEAIAEWKKKSEIERTVEVKAGWFSKIRVEDTEKREEFINNYIKERLNKNEQ